MNKMTVLPTLVVVGLLVVILLAVACLKQVSFNQVGVKVRLGKADDSSVIRDNPGLKFRWPLIESIITYDTRLQILDMPEKESPTKDGKQVIVGTYAVWRIADPLLFYTKVRTIGKAQQQMRTRLSLAQSAVIGQRPLSDFANRDAKELNLHYGQLLIDMLDRKEADASDDDKQLSTREQLKLDFGIDEVRMGIRRISLPAGTTEEVFKSMRQERNNLAAKYRQTGRAEAEGIKARAESNAQQILAFAERRASEIESAGIQAAKRILERIPEEDREFYEWLRWLDALRATLAQKTTIFIDQNSPLFAPFVHSPVSPQEQN